MPDPEPPQRPVRKAVLEGPAGDSWDAVVPADIAVSRLIAKFVREPEFGLRAIDDRGNLINYRLIVGRLNRSLDGSQTLLQAGVLDGDKITITPELTAGGSAQSPVPDAGTRERVFIVHGHDDAMREAVARFIEKIGFIAVSLSENVNRGRTIIEKFEHHSNVKFAVILLSPDDFGSKAGTPASPRARQNVLLEWGYFMGRLGRDRALALKKGDIELPSDVLGVLWEPFDDYGHWKIKLARELDEAGYEIDWRTVARG
jgi:predicted nucleotide-binding protein